MNDKEKLFIEQIEDITKGFNKCESFLRVNKDSYEARRLALNLNSRIMATIVRITGTKSEYYKQAKEIVDNTKVSNPIGRLALLFGIVTGLYEDLKAGYLKTFSEFLQAEIFSDYLEMAEYLLEEGYKDPAAVITGSTLEEHLRKLCLKNGIDVEETKGGKTRPKKVDTLNSELAKQNVYNKLEQKSVTGWLDLRNKAAHGQYGEYDDKQVDLMIKGVRDFINRNPA